MGIVIVAVWHLKNLEEAKQYLDTKFVGLWNKHRASDTTIHLEAHNSCINGKVTEIFSDSDTRFFFVLGGVDYKVEAVPTEDGADVTISRKAFCT